MWVGEKRYSLTVAQKSSTDRRYNAFRVCEIFCTLEVCAMGRQISTLWLIRKVDSVNVVETLAIGFILLQAIGFIMLSVSVGYSAHFRLV